ncbi:MAG: hypothetical protein IT393_00750 [Nitrospirae bacterium]|nr:hypothetical protein [Nitrospirota bacterium]
MKSLRRQRIIIILLCAGVVLLNLTQIDSLWQDASQHRDFATFAMKQLRPLQGRLTAGHSISYVDKYFGGTAGSSRERELAEIRFRAVQYALSPVVVNYNERSRLMIGYFANGEIPMTLIVGHRIGRLGNGLYILSGQEGG